MLQSKFIKILEKIIKSVNYANDSPIGIQFGPSNIQDKPIRKVLITENASMEAINYARKNNCNLIISYFPLINETVLEFGLDEGILNKIMLLNHSHISLYSIGRFIDDEILAYIPDFQMEDIIQISSNNKDYILGFKIKLREHDKKFEEILNIIQRQFNLNIIKYQKNNSGKITSIGFIVDEISQSSTVKLIYRKGCNCIISTHFNYKAIIDASTYGISLIEIPLQRIIDILIRKLRKTLIAEIPHLDFKFFNSSLHFDLDRLNN